MWVLCLRCALCKNKHTLYFKDSTKKNVKRFHIDKLG